jgi:hypothetical protein
MLEGKLLALLPTLDWAGGDKGMQYARYEGGVFSHSWLGSYYEYGCDIFKLPKAVDDMLRAKFYSERVSNSAEDRLKELLL